MPRRHPALRMFVTQTPRLLPDPCRGKPPGKVPDLESANGVGKVPVLDSADAGTVLAENVPWAGRLGSPENEVRRPNSSGVRGPVRVRMVPVGLGSANSGGARDP